MWHSGAPSLSTLYAAHHHHGGSRQLDVYPCNDVGKLPSIRTVRVSGRDRGRTQPEREPLVEHVPNRVVFPTMNRADRRLNSDGVFGGQC